MHCIGVKFNRIFLSFCFTSLQSELENGYCLPPPEIRDIVDAPPLPALSFSPQRDKILFLKRRSLPPLSDLARPEEKLAGIRIDGKCNSRSRMWVTSSYSVLVSVFSYSKGLQLNFITYPINLFVLWLHQEWVMVSKQGF